MSEIDVCVDYLTEIDAKYVCMDDRIVIRTSDTGHERDMKYEFLSTAQVRRIISYTISPVEDEHIMAAFQEMDEVYVKTVKSTVKVMPNILNLGAPANIFDRVSERLVQAFDKDNIQMVSYPCISDIYRQFAKRLNLDMSKKDVFIPSYIRKYVGAYGYEYRRGGRRINIGNTKVAVVARYSAHKTDYKKLTSDQVKYYAVEALRGE